MNICENLIIFFIEIYDDGSVEKKYLINKLDYIFLAIPVESIKNQLQNYLDKTSDKTLIIDLGSTKLQICNSVENHEKRKNYLAAHPIAGTEFSGPGSATKDLFNNKVMILCDTQKTDSNLLLNAKKIISHFMTVSYTHLTLPTKRIV